MVSSNRPEMDRFSPMRLNGINQSLSVRISDPDSHYAIAREAGAVIVQELQNEPHGSRGYMAKEIESHLWYFATYQPGEDWGG